MSAKDGYSLDVVIASAFAVFGHSCIVFVCNLIIRYVSVMFDYTERSACQECMRVERSVDHDVLVVIDIDRAIALQLPQSTK